MHDIPSDQELIQRHHDGELDADKAADVRAILEDASNQRELEQLRKLSGVLGQAPRPVVPAAIMQAAHEAVDRVATQAVLLRFARWSLSAAAGILLSAGVALAVVGDDVPDAGQDPVLAAMLAMNERPSEAAEDPQSAVADWIIQSLQSTAGTDARENKP